MSRLKRRESSFGDGGSRKPEAESVGGFRGGGYRVYLGATHAFSPAVEDTVRLWRTSSVPSHSVGGSSYHKGATERTACSGSRGPPTCLSFGLLLSLSFPVAMLGKAGGSRVSLPVSRREPRRRCGGRRGGLNDSQHCAVGPGLQSPQRWSFPPPPSHSPSPSTQHAAAPLSPSNHFATPRRPHFPGEVQLFPLVYTGPLCRTSGPNFKALYHVPPLPQNVNFSRCW